VVERFGELRGRTTAPRLAALRHFVETGWWGWPSPR
jgi:hypothetical protein